MNVTIKDVAKKAGVSVSTVSLVINKKSAITEETRQRVLQAIEELNYHPRRIAQGLASKRNGNIGFILTDYHFSRAEPFYTKIFLGSEFEARHHNYYLLLTTIQNKFTQSDIPRFLLEKNVDGVILAGKVPTGLIEHISGYGLPTVFVDYTPPKGKYFAVLMDNIDGAKQAVGHLIEKGHRKIAFIGGDISHPSIQSRLEGYRQALMEANLVYNEQLVITSSPNTTDIDGYQSTCALIQNGEPLTAIFAANDAMAFGCNRCLKEKNIRVPDQIALVGFDDVELAVEMEPRLTTIKVNKEDIGAIAVKSLVEMLDTNRKINGNILAPVELIVREST
ncbi:MAG: LacI family DNA-binding transcriptional regulator [bacterium]|nr:LacI family DNA-binding transcriptional regulator [bacterium]